MNCLLLCKHGLNCLVEGTIFVNILIFAQNEQNFGKFLEEFSNLDDSHISVNLQLWDELDFLTIPAKKNL